MWQRVKGKAAIVLLREYSNWDWLEPFIGREATISDAAECSSVSLRKMYHFVQRGLNAKLLKISRLEPRKGRSTKYYRAVAETFFIAFEDLETTLEEELNSAHAELKERANKALATYVQTVFDKAEEEGSGVWGRTYGRTSDKTFSQLSFASEGGLTREAEVWQRQDVAPFMFGTGVLMLSYEQVRDFQKLFNELDKKQLTPQGDKKYYINLTMVELKED